MNCWFWAFLGVVICSLVYSIERGWTAGKKARIEAERLSKKVKVIIVVDDFEHSRFLSASANADSDVCEIMVTSLYGKSR